MEKRKKKKEKKYKDKAEGGDCPKNKFLDNMFKLDELKKKDYLIEKIKRKHLKRKFSEPTTKKKKKHVKFMKYQLQNPFSKIKFDKSIRMFSIAQEDIFSIFLNGINFECFSTNKTLNF